MGKFEFGDIVYFKPSYWPECISGPLVDTFQVVKYDEEKQMYDVVYFNDIDLDPIKPYLTKVSEKDIDTIKNSIYKDRYNVNHHYFTLDADFKKFRRDNIYEINRGIIYFLANRDKYNNDIIACINEHPDKFGIKPRVNKIK